MVSMLLRGSRFAGGLFLLALSLSAETTIIDCGSPTDPNQTEGRVYMFPVGVLPPGSNDTTLRYDAFQTGITYRIAATEAQIVTLRFIDPTVTTVGGRIFSVFANNQPVLQGLDIVAEVGPLKPLSRTLLLYPSDGVINLTFKTSVRSAVISSIEYQPQAKGTPSSVSVLRGCAAARIDATSMTLTECADGVRLLFGQ